MAGPRRPKPTPMSAATALRTRLPIDGVPLGTVISSMLPFNRFAEIVGDPGTFDAKINKWAPCDGRNVKGSLYSEVSDQHRVADLRGTFIRGLNEFSTDAPAPAPPDRLDPQAGRTAGSFQSDAFEDHTHSQTIPALIDDKRVGSSSAKRIYGPAGTQTGGATAHTSSETRPKNVSMFMYLKINV